MIVASNPTQRMPRKLARQPNESCNSTNQRGYHWSNRHDGADAREFASRTIAFIEITDNRAGKHDRSRTSDRLQGARNDQGLDVGCC